jgi:hypothetical protein
MRKVVKKLLRICKKFVKSSPFTENSPPYHLPLLWIVYPWQYVNSIIEGQSYLAHLPQATFWINLTKITDKL